MKITFAGLKTTGKVETVWAVIDLQKYILSPWQNAVRLTDYVIVWGKRGGKLRTIRLVQEYYFELHQEVYRSDWIPVSKHHIAKAGYSDVIAFRIFNKLKSGYRPVKSENLSDVYPTFEKDLDKINFWEVLK